MGRQQRPHDIQNSLQLRQAAVLLASGRQPDCAHSMSRITCNFQGRLGNCMFETAAVLATAWRQNLTPCFPANECDYYRGITAFQHYLKPLLQKYPSFVDPAPFRVHEDNLYQYAALPAFESDTMLKGFYTCSQYFKDYRKEIIDVFRSQ